MFLDQRPSLSNNRTNTEAVGERGATAVFIAFTLVLLMGMAAVAVDSGIVFNDRRQQQSAADVGALAAIQFAKTESTALCSGSGAALAACRGAEEAMAVVEGTLPGRYDPTEWLACVDATKPVEFTRDSALSPCISFTNNFQKARVVLPGTDVDTAFARVIGFDSVAVGAFAEARVDLNQSAAVLPFALGPTPSDQACLFANSTSNLKIDPCNGPVEGNFGKLDMALYGNTTLGTPQICGNAMPNTKMGVNIVVGSDHFIEENLATSGSVEDFSNCPIFNNKVDRLNTQTGNSANGMEDGLFTGISMPALEGRLMCKGGLSTSTAGESADLGKVSSSCVDVLNQFPEKVDDTPLWNFITSYASNNYLACSAVGDRQAMESCITAWRVSSPPASESLLTDSVRYSTRFAAVPLLDTAPGGGTGTYDVVEFRPVYLSTFYLKCNANTCDVVHSPGEAAIPAVCPNPLTPAINSCGWLANGNKGIVALTAYILTLDMLDPEIRDTFPAAEGTAVFNLSR